MIILCSDNYLCDGSKSNSEDSEIKTDKSQNNDHNTQSDSKQVVIPPFPKSKSSKKIFKGSEKINIST